MRKALFFASTLLVLANAFALCGDDVCDFSNGESRSNCCVDCPCGFRMVCADYGSCVSPEYLVEPVEVTGRATTTLYGFEGGFIALVIIIAVGVLVLYKLRT